MSGTLDIISAEYRELLDGAVQNNKKQLLDADDAPPQGCENNNSKNIL